jgi:hypothetical protein
VDNLCGCYDEINVVWNDIGDESSRSPTLPEAVDEQDIKCGVVFMQLLQETQADTDTEEPSFISSIEIVLNVELVCRSVGDGVADTSLISYVDLEPIATEFVQDVELSFDEPEFMLEYDAAFRDKRAEDLADDRPVPKLSNRDKALLQQALVEHAPNMPDCRDLSQAHRDVADGLRFDDSVPLISHDNVIIMMGIIFKTMEAIEIWLVEYAVFYHRPFMVKHSDENKHYVIRCHRGCPSTVHARKGNNDSWRITSVV